MQLNQRSVFAFLDDRLRQEKRCALVTIVAVEGTSMRNPGTMMGVCEDGTFAGSLLGGCVEQAVIAEAQQAIRDEASRIVRFGKGSDYIDIRFPCGGGLDIHLQPLRDGRFVTDALNAIEQRRPFAVRVALCDSSITCVPRSTPDSFDLALGEGIFGYWPPPRLSIYGHGSAVLPLVALARSLGIETAVATPDAHLADQLRSCADKVVGLSTLEDARQLETDRWTAFAFLFHDHEFESLLIDQALSREKFYIGRDGWPDCSRQARRSIARARLERRRYRIDQSTNRYIPFLPRSPHAGRVHPR